MNEKVLTREQVIEAVEEGYKTRAGGSIAGIGAATADALGLTEKQEWERLVDEVDVPEGDPLGLVVQAIGHLIDGDRKYRLAQIVAIAKRQSGLPVEPSEEAKIGDLLSQTAHISYGYPRYWQHLANQAARLLIDALGADDE